MSTREKSETVTHVKSPEYSVTFGYTLNLGNFQSMRVDIGKTDQIRPGETEDQAYERISDEVADRFVAAVKKLHSDLEEDGLA